MQFLNKYRFLDTKLRLELLCTFESTAANAYGLGKTYETQAKKCQRADKTEKKTTTLRVILNIELSALSQFNHNTSITFHFLSLILLSLDGDQSCRC